MITITNEMHTRDSVSLGSFEASQISRTADIDSRHGPSHRDSSMSGTRFHACVAYIERQMRGSSRRCETCAVRREEQITTSSSRSSTKLRPRLTAIHRPSPRSHEAWNLGCRKHPCLSQRRVDVSKCLHLLGVSGLVEYHATISCLIIMISILMIERTWLQQQSPMPLKSLLVALRSYSVPSDSPHTSAS